MTSYPALIPSSREFNPGTYPNTLYRAIGGDENTVRHGNVMVGSTLTLSYIGISEAEMLSFLLHYNLQRGSYGTFGLPALVFSGTSRAEDYTLSSYIWSYANPPEVEDWPCGGHVVSVTLESAVAPTADLITLNATITVDVGGGQAAASNGTTQTLALSLTPGEPGAFVDVPSVIMTVAVDVRPNLANIIA
jgi:hypothetical protein